MNRITPKLNPRDYVRLFLFMTPEEMKAEFPTGSVSSPATIYRIVEDYYKGNKKEHNKMLRALLTQYCDVDITAKESQKDVETWIAMAKAEIISEIKLRLESEAGIFN